MHDDCVDDLFGDSPEQGSPRHGPSGAVRPEGSQDTDDLFALSSGSDLDEGPASLPQPMNVPVALVPAAAASVASAEPAARTRGRPKGATWAEMTRRRFLAEMQQQGPPGEDASLAAGQEEQEQEPVAPRTRRARQAAAARWANHRQKRAAETEASHNTLSDIFAAQAAVRDAENQIVPFDPNAAPRSLAAVSVPQLGGQLALFQPQQKAKEAKVEQHLVCNFCHTMSQRSVAQIVGRSHKTLKLKKRLLAFCMVIGRRHFNTEVLRGFHEYFLRVHAAVTAPLYWATKYKYDGMSAKVSITQSESVKKSSAKVSELMQVTVYHVALYNIMGRYVQLHMSSPTTLRTIECNKAGCIKNAVNHQLHCPPTAKEFPRRAKMPVCDAHGSNAKSDLSMLLDDPGAEIDKTLCKAHAGHRVADWIGTASPDEYRGLMYTGLAFAFAGKDRCFKTNLKRYARRVFDYRSFGAEGAGPEAKAHRDQVLKQYASDTDSRTSGNRAARRLKFYLKTESLLNGRWWLTGTMEHFCRPGCHDSKAEALEDIDDWIEDLDLPLCHCKSRWIGAEQPADSVGLLTGVHDVFTPVMIETHEAAEKAKPADPHDPDEPMPALADREEDGEEGVADDDLHAAHDEELTLPTPEKDVTQEERQSTYRGNSLKWIKSNPQGHLWAYRNVLREQQSMQTFMVRNSANAFRKRETKRRVEGKQPQYIPLLAADGYYTKKSMEGYCDLVLSDKKWQAMPSKYASHAVALSATRMGLAASAATYQLLEMPFTEFTPYAIVLQGTVRQKIAAACLLETYKRRPCTLRPWLWRHVRACGATLEGLLEPDNVAVLECHLDFMELENIATESLNATIRRFIARCVQHKVQSTPASKVARPFNVEIVVFIFFLAPSSWLLAPGIHFSFLAFFSIPFAAACGPGS